MCLLLVAAVFLPVARRYILAGGEKKERVEGGKNGYEGEEGGGIGGGEEEKSPPLYCSVHSAQYSLSFFLSLPSSLLSAHTQVRWRHIPTLHFEEEEKEREERWREGGREGGWAFVCWAASEEDGTKRGEGGSAIQGAQESKERKHKCICLSCTYVRVLKTRFRIRDTR